MTAAFANVTPAAPTDGIIYANQMLMPASEGVIYNGASTSPLSVISASALVADVILTVSGSLSSNVSYVILQGDLGNDVWYDLSGIRWTGTSGSASFRLSAGAPQANAFEQTRASGTAPAANFQNQCPLPGRVRFVGQATITGGGTVRVSVRVKRLGLR